MNLVQRALGHGGQIAPLVLPKEYTNGTGLMNPSVFVDDDGDILVNLRHVNYTLYHAERHQRFPTIWGPLAYLHPENDQHLKTYNYLCRLNDDLEMTDFAPVQMLDLHTPIWEFHGLEDARLVQWEGEYFLIGVRRDTTPNGQGRMEYSRIEIDKDTWTITETGRLRIPAPGDDSSYCEKNWVPVLDRPYRFVKWTSPLEVVKAEPDFTQPTIECTTDFVKPNVSGIPDQRGSSHMIRYGQYRLSITHEVNLYSNYLKQKDAVYRHRLCVWDEDFRLIGLSDPFAFFGAQIEFCAGLAQKNGELLISFGFHDSSSFILVVPQFVTLALISEALSHVA